MATLIEYINPLKGFPDQKLLALEKRKLFIFKQKKERKKQIEQAY
jgi:hypothetical protein